jgi:hypothetical protein
MTELAVTVLVTADAWWDRHGRTCKDVAVAVVLTVGLLAAIHVGSMRAR